MENFGKSLNVWNWSKNWVDFLCFLKTFALFTEQHCRIFFQQFQYIFFNVNRQLNRRILCCKSIFYFTFVCVLFYWIYSGWKMFSKLMLMIILWSYEINSGYISFRELIENGIFETKLFIIGHFFLDTTGPTVCEMICNVHIIVTILCYFYNFLHTSEMVIKYNIFKTIGFYNFITPPELPFVD